MKQYPPPLSILNLIAVTNRNLPNHQLNRLQQIQNSLVSLARAAVKAPKSSDHSYSQISPLA